VLWAHHGEGEVYLDLFTPFIAQCALDDERVTIPVDDLIDQAEARFGFRLPHGVARTALRRAAKRGLGVLEHGGFTPDRKKLSPLGSSAELAQAEREQGEMARRFQSYVEAFDVTLTEDQAAELLADFVEHHASAVLGAARGNAGTMPEFDPAEREYLVASFILEVAEPDPLLVQYVERLVTGSMLAAAMYTPGNPEQNTRMDGVTFYLDTGILLNATGASGPTAARACGESLRIIRETGARVVCFEHNVREMQNVLHAVGQHLSTPKAGDVPTRGVEQHAIEQGWTAQDLSAKALQVPSDLARVGISILDAPGHIEHLTIDEASAEEALAQCIQHSTPTSRVFDLQSLTAIHRMRRGNVRYRIEDCNAVFVTTNGGVLHAARMIFPNPTRAVPVAMHLSDITTLAWLKRPVSAPDLPRLRVIADCYTAIQPSAHLMDTYYQQSVKLLESGRIGDEEIFQLRYGLEERRILMQLTHGDPKNVTDENVLAVLDRGAERQRREGRKEADDEYGRKLADLERKWRTAEADAVSSAEVLGQAQELEARQLESRARRHAQLIVWSPLVAVFALVILVLASNAPWFGPDLKDAPVFSSFAGWLPRWVAGVALLATVGLTAWGTTWGGWLTSISQVLRPPVQAFLLRRYSRRSVFQPPSGS
jgi:hypothetical protein